jgi:methylated-DNA-protein-cysteine methyltransferase related protein
MKYSSPPDPAAFKRIVWDIVRQVPPGNVTTYGYVASLIPPPIGMDAGDYRSWGARWVGGAMASCPIDVPWQRVINAQGKISLRAGSGGSRQRELLEEEGVDFDDRQRVDLTHYAWDGPGDDWLRAHGLAAGEDSAKAG